MNQTTPPAAEGLPLAALDSATEGANRLDAWARDPHGRNFLAHALVQLARDGWLRAAPGEGFEPMRDPAAVPAAETTNQATLLAEFLPDWEAVYEPGNVSDYLIGYANDQDAATGAAEAWLRSQAEVTGRLEWVADDQLATGRYDHWFELVERHDGGIDTGPGIIVRRRVAAEEQPETQPGCAHCGDDHSWDDCEAYTALVASEQQTETGYGPSAEELAGHIAAQRISVLQGAFRILGWRLNLAPVNEEQPAGEQQCSARPCNPAADELCDRHAQIRYHAEGEHAFCEPGCDTDGEA